MIHLIAVTNLRKGEIQYPNDSIIGAISLCTKYFQYLLNSNPSEKDVTLNDMI